MFRKNSFLNRHCEINAHMTSFHHIIYIVPTVLLVTYSQVVLKWRIAALGEFPSDNWDRVMFLIKALLDPFIASGVLAAFIASLAWMVAISKVPLNVGFPIYYGLTFALVIFFSIWFLNEPVTSLKIIGVGLILIGVIVGSMG
jgi:multidrug transporter EmrE-like cation transporter